MCPQLYRHQQQEVFADKSNQIVIEQYFNTYISPIQRRKLYRYAIILLVLTLLGKRTRSTLSSSVDSLVCL